jgi:hypothetical protein
MYLPCCINDFSCIVLALVADDFAERVLNGWIVGLDEMSVHELDRQTRFACLLTINYVALTRGEHASSMSTGPQGRTNSSAAHNGNLALLWRRHVVACSG